MNYFNVMLKKRIKNDDKEVEMEEAEKIVQSKSKKKSKDFVSVITFLILDIECFSKL